jgi:cell division protein FtsL
MFLKLAALICGIAITACALLAARQLRTQTAHELSQARLRVMRLDNERWKLRSEIASLITPEHIKEMASRQTPLKPIAGEFATPIPQEIRR